MIRYDVLPLVGIGPVHLGMSRAQSRRAMGPEPPEPYKKFPDQAFTDAYYDNSFQVFFDDRDVVEYIELSPSEFFGAFYKGVDVHRTKAAEMVTVISKDAPFDPDIRDLGYSYIFPGLELSLWRPTVPEDGEGEWQCFATVGVGRKGYYSQ
jgi:hypothetical protein